MHLHSVKLEQESLQNAGLNPIGYAACRDHHSHLIRVEKRLVLEIPVGEEEHQQNEGLVDEAYREDMQKTVKNPEPALRPFEGGRFPKSCVNIAHQWMSWKNSRSRTPNATKAS